MRPAFIALIFFSLFSRGFAQVVRPSGAAIPENLLRLSIRFEHPQAQAVLPRLALRRDDGVQVAEPFLDQELWTPDRRIVTILMHPGRVKTGLLAHDGWGRALSSGDPVTLTLNGRPLKRWNVLPAVQRRLPIEDWEVETPRAGTRDVLVLRLHSPIDALDADMIAVRAADGRRVKGVASLSEGETVWQFKPADRWSRGTYALATASELEDPEGNRPDLDFEHPALSAAEAISTPTFVLE